MTKLTLTRALRSNTCYSSTKIKNIFKRNKEKTGRSYLTKKDILKLKIPNRHKLWILHEANMLSKKERLALDKLDISWKRPTSCMPFSSTCAWQQLASYSDITMGCLKRNEEKTYYDLIRGGKRALDKLKEINNL